MGRRLMIIGGSQQGRTQENVPRDVRHRGTPDGLEAGWLGGRILSGMAKKRGPGRPKPAKKCSPTTTSAHLAP
jgi:hypothetical protein